MLKPTQLGDMPCDVSVIKHVWIYGYTTVYVRADRRIIQWRDWWVSLDTATSCTWIHHSWILMTTTSRAFLFVCVLESEARDW